MGQLRNYITKIHKSTKRNYVSRMLDKKVECMKVAKRYGKDYWDGDRRYGYGGYKYIPGRWTNVAKKLIKDYKIKPGSKILDIGCGKGFLMHEIIQLEPLVKVFGIEESSYAIKNSIKTVKENIIKCKAQKKYPFKKKYFDLVISFGTLHNLELEDLQKSLDEIDRVSKKSYVMVESFRNESELFNLQCWALTCESFFSKKTWISIFSKYKNLDYEFIYFE